MPAQETDGPPPQMKWIAAIVAHIRADSYVLMYWLAHLVPKNPRLWVFGAMRGHLYCDNPRHLFEYVMAHHPSVRCIWLSLNMELVESIRDQGLEAYPAYSLRGGWLAARAGLAVICVTRAQDLNPWAITKPTKTLQLWHGTPLKKILADDKKDHCHPWVGSPPKKRGLFQLLNLAKQQYLWRLFPNESFELLTAPSPEVKQIFLHAFQIPDDRCIITGYPRTDALFRDPVIPHQPDQRMAIYLPTWRGHQGSQADFFEFDVAAINARLAANNVVLYFRPHPLNKPRAEFEAAIRRSSNLRVIDHLDIYDILGSFNILITDFSSVYFDFLLLDRPIVFAPMGFNDYITQDRELYYEYNSITPGPKAHSWDELVSVVLEELAQPDRYSKARRALRDRFNTYLDGNNCQRVTAAAFTLLGIK